MSKIAVVFWSGTGNTEQVKKSPMFQKPITYELTEEGVQISQEALTSRTSLLQSITFDAPIHVIGTNTNDCMKSGAIYGNAVMIDGIADLIEDTLKKEFTVIATGGLANCIIPYCRRKIILDENLLLKGLWLIYEKNKDSHKQ